MDITRRELFASLLPQRRTQCDDTCHPGEPCCDWCGEAPCICTADHSDVVC